MKKYFVDTNVFLRAILEDHQSQSPRAQNFLSQISFSSAFYFTTPWVITEIIWTLSSLYRVPKQKVIETIQNILNTSNIKIIDKNLVVAALALYEKEKIDFIDCINYLLAKDNQADIIISFDRDFDKLQLPRKEP